MSTGETVAVKVLATDSKQGEKEFQTEVVMDNAQSFTVLDNLVRQFNIMYVFYMFRKKVEAW